MTAIRLTALFPILYSEFFVRHLVLSNNILEILTEFNAHKLLSLGNYGDSIIYFRDSNY
jgi:hypothetical protein